MSDFNPMVGDTAQDTLNNMIETLTLVSSILTIEPANENEDPPKPSLKTSDLAGLKQMVLCVKGAAENCYQQCAKPNDTKL